MANVFKAYDIRGVYPQEIDEVFAERLGKALVTYIHTHAPGMLITREIIVGHDMRSSGPALYKALARGILASGVNVMNVGMIATEQLYFACGLLNRPGITVSASHNPKEYNGFKMVMQVPTLIRGEEIKEIFDQGEFATVGSEGKKFEKDIHAEYVDKVRSFIHEETLLPLSLVIDTANGMGGPLVERAFEGLPFQITKMFFEPDGTFPNHPADPSIAENRHALEERVKQEKADCGLAFDGDADRCFVVDENGNSVPGDFFTALLAQSVLKNAPAGTPVVYDLRASWAVADYIRAAGGVSVVERVGHAFIKPRMKQEKAIFGGEVSGHYYYRDFYYSDSGIITALKVCELLSQSGKTMSELLEPLRSKYFITGEINSKVADAHAVMERIVEKYKDAKVSRLDGIAIEYPDWHCSVRSSNTEPLLRLNLEARSQVLMEQKRDEVLTLIRS